MAKLSFNWINIIIFPLILSACTRPEVQKSSVKIQFPQVNSTLQSQEATFVDKLLSTANATNTVTSTSTLTPSGFSGNYPINCYVIFVSGPEPELKRSNCGRKSDSSFPRRYLGPWAGGILPEVA